ncbi:hypothetical protein [Tenacibaculum bernardetii]|uniref:hypothetical protein n=1 Tax=Tenacibaculum bernardetii TaxID=3021375 RepID=UPI0023B027CB|nr:hypothetical protein [Tenacibaculum bernardetii]
MKKQNFNKLPTLNELKDIIAEINAIDLKSISYDDLITKIRSLQFIPFLTAKLNKGYHIERARINKPNEIFTDEKEISYRRDSENIKTYGRANSLQNSMFYGAVESDVIKHPRMVNLLETSQIFRDLEKNEIDNADFVMTVGKWRIKETLEVVELVFDEKSIQNSKDVQKSYEYHLANIRREMPENAEQFELILKFFSNQFSNKNIVHNSDYMISAAYTDLAIGFRGFPGIKYPSVKTDYQGYNVVLTPTAVDQFLELEIAAMYRVIKENKKSYILPLKHVTDFGKDNGSFNWIDYKPERFDINEIK